MGSPTHAEAVWLGLVHDLGQPAPHLLEHFFVLGCLPLEHDRQHVNLHTCAHANIQFGRVCDSMSERVQGFGERVCDFMTASVW
jgi:hypothetical protein